MSYFRKRFAKQITHTWYLLSHGTLIAAFFFEFIINCNSFLIISREQIKVTGTEK
jgi:hypothetical protein